MLWTENDVKPGGNHIGNHVGNPIGNHPVKKPHCLSNI